MPVTPLPRLVAITDLTRFSPSQLLAGAALLARAAAPGSVALLLRDHQASARERLALGRELARMARAAEQELWVADRLDLALTLDADALHLGESSVTALEARQLLGEDRRVSRAWHDAGPLSERASAELEGVDVLLLSPIIAARKGRPALGVAALSGLIQTLSGRPHAPRLIALGGVTASTAPSCLAAGAWGVAVLDAAWSAGAFALVQALGIAR